MYKYKCYECDKMYPIDNFYLDKQGFPFRHLCKKCECERQNAWRHKNKDKAKAIRDKYKKNNPEKVLASARKGKLRYIYDLSEEDYDHLFLAQRGLCALCSLPMGTPFIDHVAGTKIVRGLIHQNCNSMIGFANHDPRLLELGIMYLENRDY